MNMTDPRASARDTSSNLERTLLRLAPSHDAVSLAVVRIATGLLTLHVVWQVVGRPYHEIPDALRWHPVGTSWLESLLPFHEIVVALTFVGLLAFTIGYRVPARHRGALMPHLVRPRDTRGPRRP